MKSFIRASFRIIPSKNRACRAPDAPRRLVFRSGRRVTLHWFLFFPELRTGSRQRHRRQYGSVPQSDFDDHFLATTQGCCAGRTRQWRRVPHFSRRRRAGRQVVVNSRAVPYGVALIGVTSPAGIRTIEVVQVGPQPGFYGPLALARVLFSNTPVRHVPRSRYSPPPKRKPVPQLRRAVSRLARS